MANCGRPGWLASQPFPDVGLASHQLQTRMKSRYRASERRYTTSDYQPNPRLPLPFSRTGGAQAKSIARPRSCGHPLRERPKELLALLRKPTDRTLHLTKTPQARYEAFKLRHSSVQEAQNSN
ncbi:Uncharacterized protein DBV15_03620 [Temnothorax longispinosus]|uniref:Uncharacterized protein n=1 Tax=Temnothorax longispinosus TaxID=300112 RepID=A0A4S2KQ96_9HYME|nr:Uncharacterized protein DBV15_03620 [Temnothorax longispinosus]